MKKIIYSLIIATVFLHDRAHAQDSTLFPRGEIGKNTNNYTGTIWLNELNHPDSTFNFSIAQAIYAPHSKLDWHIHPGGQYLLITEGIGYYQEKGKTGQVVQKGDVIKCLPGVAHWHGAAPGSSFAYVAVSPTTKGKTIWLQRVTDAEYNSVEGNITSVDSTPEQQEIINISKAKWQWMADKKVDSLNNNCYQVDIIQQDSRIANYIYQLGINFRLLIPYSSTFDNTTSIPREIFCTATLNIIAHKQRKHHPHGLAQLIHSGLLKPLQRS